MTPVCLCIVVSCFPLFDMCLLVRARLISGFAAILQEIVARFQRDAGIPVCLLSSQVGGLGLTLTAANRVIVADPAWNPATDNQAVDRSPFPFPGACAHVPTHFRLDAITTARIVV